MAEPSDQTGATAAQGEISRDELLKALEDSGFAEPGASVTPEDGTHAPSAPPPAPAEAAKQPDHTPKDSAKTEEAADPTREDKSRQRAADEWQKINAEKARLEAERAKLKGEAAPKYSADDYEALAKEYEAEGRDDLAKAARTRAGQAREQAEQAEAEKAIRQFEAKRNEVIQAACKQHPDLLKPETELFKAVEGLLKRKPMLLRYPEGFADAVEAAQAFLKAGRVDALTKEVAELKQQLADREQLLQPGTGGPHSATRTVNFESLPPEEQRNRLLAELSAMEQG